LKLRSQRFTSNGRIYFDFDSLDQGLILRSGERQSFIAVGVWDKVTFCVKILYKVRKEGSANYIVSLNANSVLRAILADSVHEFDSCPLMVVV
jgi:hypothetical protein